MERTADHRFQTCLACTEICPGSRTSPAMRRTTERFLNREFESCHGLKPARRRRVPGRRPHHTRRPRRRHRRPHPITDRPCESTIVDNDTAEHATRQAIRHPDSSHPDRLAPRPHSDHPAAVTRPTWRRRRRRGLDGLSSTPPNVASTSRASRRYALKLGRCPVLRLRQQAQPRQDHLHATVRTPPQSSAT
jgi:hypothetical protein